MAGWLRNCYTSEYLPTVLVLTLLPEGRLAARKVSKTFITDHACCTVSCYPEQTFIHYHQRACWQKKIPLQHLSQTMLQSVLLPSIRSDLCHQWIVEEILYQVEATSSFSKCLNLSRHLENSSQFSY